MILIFMYLHFSGVILVVLLSYYLDFAMEMEDNTVLGLRRGAKENRFKAF